MDSFYDRLLQQFQRLKKSPKLNEIDISFPEYPNLITLIRERGVLIIVYEDPEREAVRVLRVEKKRKPTLTISHIQGNVETSQQTPIVLVEFILGALLRQLAKVEA